MNEQGHPAEQLLAALGANAHAVAELAVIRFSTFPDTRVDQARLVKLGRENVRVTQELHELLATDERAGLAAIDIDLIAELIGQAVNSCVQASDLLEVHHVEAAMEQSLEQCRLLRAATRVLAGALAEVTSSANVRPDLSGVHAIEEQGNHVVADAMTALFEQEDVSPRVILQWKDIFETLEAALNACRNAANAVENAMGRDT